MTLTTILLVVLILILVGVLPTWSHASSYGWTPAVVVVVLLFIMVVLMLSGRI